MAFERMISGELSESKVKAIFVRIGSMFCLFFREPGVVVRNLADAQRSDLRAYAKFFHSMLAGGVYFPPSQFETCFLSMAHGDRELELTQLALRHALHAKA